MIDRVFIALPISGHLLAELRSKTVAKQSQTTGWRWARPDIWHITVRWLGTLSDDQAARLAQYCHELSAKITAPMNVEITSLELYPSERRPQTLSFIVGLNEQMLRLWSEARDWCYQEGIGASDRKGFKPHISVARFPKGMKIHFLSERMKILGELDTLSLFQSELREDGPEYISLTTATFS
ncbi:MAG: RNA 2',3'-cyclic phosphodiesterase [bacterium]|nr:RNA 2',3'-cyclic phosphodiesterase [bacterium]